MQKTHIAMGIPFIAAAFDAHFRKTAVWKDEPQSFYLNSVSNAVGDVYPIKKAVDDLANTRNDILDTYSVLDELADPKEAAEIGQDIKEKISIMCLELQALESTVKMAAKADKSQAAYIKPVSLALEAVRNLESLLKQMTDPAKIYESQTNRKDLKQLAEHGTSVAKKFH